MNTSCQAGGKRELAVGDIAAHGEAVYPRGSKTRPAACSTLTQARQLLKQVPVLQAILLGVEQGL
jgi:hypothetical protein